MQLALTLTTDDSAHTVWIEAPEETAWSAVTEAYDLPATGWHTDDGPVTPAATLGRPPLVHGAALSSTPPQQETPGRPVLDVWAAGGPDAGRRWRLGVGRHLVGRSTGAELALTDPALSRRHALLTVGPDTATLTDLGSTNGITVDDDPVGHDAQKIAAGSTVRLGTGTLRLALPTTGPAGGVPRGDGTIDVNRTPRFAPQLTETIVDVPRPPDPPHQPRISWPVLLLPLVVSGAAAAFLRAPTFLIFGLLGPAMTLAQWASDRRTHAEHRGDAERAHTLALQRAAARTADLLHDERCLRHLMTPDVATAVAATTERTERLWARSPGDADWTSLTLGRGTVPAVCGVRSTRGDVTHPPLRDVPLAVQLAEAGVLGVCGTGATPAVRSLILQLAAWHSPRDLRLWVIAESPETLSRWAWTAWLPHVSAAAEVPRMTSVDDAGPVLAELGALLGQRPRERAPGAGVPSPTQVVLLLGAGRVRARAGVADLLRDGPTRGIVTLAVDESREDLPAECRVVATIAPDRVVLTESGGSRSGLPDLVAADVAEATARRLAPLRDATPGMETEIPALVRLGEVDPEALDAGALVARWQTTPATTSFVLGRSASGDCTLDLRRDGPHVLVGGTTGSGKSELLRAFVSALAAGNRPDRLTFVLVDYKGGSAFDACSRFPHVTGLVTDLDGEGTRRALVGLEAELRTREHLLREAGAGDLDAYDARVDAGALGPDGRPLRHLPRLVVVIDEYRQLADEQPDFVSGLVRLAAVGRSLGLHLVLATQRPAGAVTAEMRANISLRIALRVRDVTDSQDVVECDLAARLGTRSPGRAVVRTADGDPVLAQTTYVGSSPVAAAPTLTLRQAEDARGLLLPDSLPVRVRRVLGSAPSSPSRGTELDRLADALAQAAATLDVPPPAPVWLPPLPAALTVAQLGAGAAASAAPVPPVLLVDDPAGRCRAAAGWDPRAGHLAIVGRSGSGRTSIVRALLATGLCHLGPDDLTVHVVDPSGELQALTGFPHVASYLRLDEESALRRLCHGLAPAGSCRSVDARHQLLVLDGFDSLRPILENLAGGSPLEALHQVLRAGAAAGLTVLATGERALLSGTAAPLFGERWLLDLTDPTDAYLAGLDPADGGLPPGRLRLPDGRDAQAALLARPAADDGDSGAQARRRHVAREEQAVAALARRILDGGASPRWGVRSLPDVLHPDDLAVCEDGGIAVGVTEDGAPLVLGAKRRSLLIGGPHGSGRTTALEAIAASAASAGHDVVRIPTGRPGDAGIRQLADSLDPERSLAVVDDVERLADAVDDLLTRFLAEGGAVLATGAIGELSASYRGVVGALRRRQCGLLLAPDARAVELFGLPLPGREPPRPGRGYLVEDGRVTAVQLVGPPRNTAAMPTTAAAPRRTPMNA